MTREKRYTGKDTAAAGDAASIAACVALACGGWLAGQLKREKWTFLKGLTAFAVVGAASRCSRSTFRCGGRSMLFRVLAAAVSPPSCLLL